MFHYFPLLISEPILSFVLFENGFSLFCKECHKSVAHSFTFPFVLCIVLQNIL